MIWLRESKQAVHLDWTLLYAACGLAVLGLVMMSSAAIEYAAVKYNNPFFHTQRHSVYLLLGIALGVAVYKVPLSLWEKSGWLLLAGGFALLVLILVPGVGHTANGSTRWLAIGGFTLQGSEVVKFAVVIYLSGYIVRQQERVRSHWSGFFNPMLVMMLLIVLLLCEPDFGAVVVLMSAALGMLFLGGVKIWQFLLLIVASLLAVALMAVASPYRMKRLMAFADPWADQFNSGYQLTQSLIAFGRGEWFGLGLGNSVQKLFYLPEAHTDFVFAILAEELGLVGALLTLALYGLLIARFFIIGRRAELAEKNFAAYVAYGVALLFSAQVFINVGVNVGLLPTKGLTLPFLSYGGSSLLLSCALVALVLRISADTALAGKSKGARRREAAHA